MAIKYQVFVSSTYDDLRDEREQVLKATLEMGHIPVGMEMFSAADEEQWKIITRQIDECDYYAVIVAHRYGSAVEGVSYTEKEYDYAITKGIPVIGFVIEKGAAWPADRIDTEQDKKHALDQFKAKVKKKPVSFWTSAADLHGKFSISLIKQIASTPRPGWIRATDVAGPEVTKELARLSGENAELRARLSVALNKSKEDAAHERARIIGVLNKNSAKLHFFYEDGEDWEDLTSITLFRLFYIVATELMIEGTTERMSRCIAIECRPNKSRKLRSKFPVPSNAVKHWFSDLITLGVICPSSKRHAVSDTNEYWSLTDLGKDVYAQIRLQVLELGEPDASSPSLKMENSGETVTAAKAKRKRNARVSKKKA